MTENLYLQKDINTPPIKISLLLHYDNYVSLYHPNEIFACEMAHQIMNDNVHYKMKEFFKKI